MTRDDTDTDINEHIAQRNGTSTNKTHPWRICPLGKHFVNSHPEHIPPSKEYPKGHTIIRKAHCADNPSHKDLLSIDEIHAMSETHFSSLSGPPRAGVLTEFHKADNFDVLIRGWVRYWNDIFHLKDPLNPNLVKALMATESSFDEKAENKIKNIHARGLLQITGQTWNILKDHHGELSNYLIDISEHDLFDPSANICSGIRWLFRKKITASSKLHREATWEEAIIDYKCYSDDVNHGTIPKALLKLREYFSELEG